MSYRPITDTWILARGRTRYYGNFPLGFLHRARQLIGASLSEPVLHVCSGKIKEYPYRGLGERDRTMDLDPELKPDYCQDVREPWPSGLPTAMPWPWKAVLIDPPYSAEDCAKYACGADVYPEPGQLLKRAWEVIEPGNRVGILHYLWPRPPKDAISVAVVSVLVGFGNRGRLFSVFEKPMGDTSNVPRP